MFIFVKLYQSLRKQFPGKIMLILKHESKIKTLTKIFPIRNSIKTLRLYKNVHCLKHE